VWGKSAENCAQYLQKGRSVYIEGRLQTREWEDKDGNKRQTTETIAQTVQFLGGRGGAGGGGGAEPGGGPTGDSGSSGTGSGGGESSGPPSSDVPF
jgi:single-strand DNA-binding protein